jgi:hypothetical protein
VTNPAFYKIKVKGHLDAHWSEWLDGLTLTHEPSGETLFAGPVVDQAALLALLFKINNLNLVLLSVCRVEPK